MDHRKVKFGIIGFGAIGPRHKEKIEEHAQAELVAVCDIDRSKLDNFAGSSVQVFTNYKDLLQLKEIEVVSVCTPNHLHPAMTIDALQAGKHVLCEKPMALTSRECKMMVHTALKENKKLFIVKQNRYNPPITRVQKLLEEKRLGNLFSIVLNCYWNRGNGYYANSNWRGRRQKDGGALFTQFSHFVDLMLMFGGTVDSVYTLMHNFNHPEIDIEDTGVVALRFCNGMIGSINFTNCSYKKNMEGSITLFAEKGTVKIGGQYLNELEYQAFEGEPIKDLPASSKANDYGSYQGSMSNHDKVYENVIDSLTNGGKVAVSGIEGMWTTEVIEAAYKSAETGTCVHL